MIADFKTRWPALFHVHEVCVEFQRITTIHLESKFFSELDAHSADLIKVFAKKGGVQGRQIRSVMTETDSIDVKRECLLKSLCVYLNEDPEMLVKEYLSNDDNSLAAMAETVFGVFVIRLHGAGPSENPEDVVILLEGVKVLHELRYVPFAVAMLLALVYALNLSYPRELKYTFEALQKVIMNLDGNKLSAKVQALKTMLSR
ncbi:uncharacterized protein LOC133021098 [Limanda limanda]|uniref:uncharacterized protein LOC133021098 n=1 Tax=Limanda limanda TaxID=27771 RepID=UPI0029C5FBEA|nr:uncharacterized protein LOC133021098 [Limanda limanda]XP_060943851.1 uncharacterized protein LOC133021098 [Limanda limanda]